VRQAKELGITVQILAEEGSTRPSSSSWPGRMRRGDHRHEPRRDDPRPVVQNFLKSYKATYKIDPDMVGASSYDAFMILVNAIGRAGSTNSKASSPP